ncbi:MAG: DUF6468 domain-containing protein [Pseudomonadota bacterium]
MTLDLVTSAVLGLLLLAMIVSAWRLERRLKSVRAGKEELQALIEGLNKATERAQASIVEMRAAAKQFEGTWEGSVGKARALADELALITHAGENLANRLEQRLADLPDAAARPSPVPPAAKTEDNDVVRALRGVR